MGNDTFVIASTSDLHVPSTVGLCPIGGIPLADGGHYLPSKAQKWLWYKWINFWSDVDDLVERENAKKIVLINGDITEKDHHNTFQIPTKNMKTQRWAALEVLKPALVVEPYESFVLSGTPAHTGGMSEHEAQIAREIGAHPCTETGYDTWFELRLLLNDVLFDFRHHGRSGYRPWTEGNAVTMLAAEIFYRHAAAGERHPDIAVRSHKHTCKDSYDNHPTRVITLPAWQFQTEFVHRVVTEIVLPSIGGVIFVCRPDADVEVIKKIYKPERDKPWTPKS